MLAPTELARLWVKITGLIPDVPLTPAVVTMVGAFDEAEPNTQRFFTMHTDRFLQKAYRKVQG
ncbi:MAG: hypothetical protein ACYTF8_00885 [Planctomycetota bacterium]